MIIELDKIPFSVEYDTDDGDIYLSSVKLHDYELVELISPEWLDILLDKVIKQIEKDNQELKNDNRD